MRRRSFLRSSSFVAFAAAAPSAFLAACDGSALDLAGASPSGSGGAVALTLGSVERAFAADGASAEIAFELDEVLLFDAEGRPLSSLGNAEGPGALNGPRAVAFAADGTVWVLDGGGHRVLRFARDGAVLADSAAAGSTLIGPVAIAAGGDGTLWVADALAGAVLRLNASGALIASHELPGRVAEPERHPRALAASGDRLFVVVGGRPSVEAWSLAGERVAVLVDDALVLPASIAATRDGRFFVVDRGTWTLRSYSAGGRLLAAEQPRLDGRVAVPLSVAITSEGDAWVVTSEGPTLPA